MSSGDDAQIKASIESAVASAISRIEAAAAQAVASMWKAKESTSSGSFAQPSFAGLAPTVKTDVSGFAQSSRRAGDSVEGRRVGDAANGRKAVDGFGERFHGKPSDLIRPEEIQAQIDRLSTDDFWLDKYLTLRPSAETGGGGGAGFTVLGTPSEFKVICWRRWTVVDGIPTALAALTDPVGTYFPTWDYVRVHSP